MMVWAETQACWNMTQRGACGTWQVIFGVWDTQLFGLLWSNLVKLDCLTVTHQRMTSTRVRTPPVHQVHFRARVRAAGSSCSQQQQRQHHKQQQRQQHEFTAGTLTHMQTLILTIIPCITV